MTVGRWSRAIPIMGLALIAAAATAARAGAQSVGQPAPEMAGGPWINSGPLTREGLRGRVVLVEFWTYG
jgi:hypothetical protein